MKIIFTKKKIFSYILIYLFVFLGNSQSAFAVSESANFKLKGGEVHMLSGAAASANFGAETGSSAISGQMSGTSFGTKQGSSFSGRAAASSATSPSLGGGGFSGGGEDVSGPKISSLGVTDIGASQARIIFTTDELAVSFVQYGPGDELNLLTDTEASFSGGHNFLIYDLIPNTKYKFIVRLRDTSTNQSNSITYEFKTLPIFKAVGNPSQFVATPKEGAINLSWVNPVLTDFGGVKLVRSSFYYASSLDEGVLLFDGQAQSYSDYNVVPGQRYYYTLFAYDTSLNYSSGAIASGVSLLKEEPSLPGEAEGEVGPVEEEEIGEEAPPEAPPEKPKIEIIVPAVPPELPVGLTPVEEEVRIEKKIETDKSIINFFGLFKQNIAKGYEKLTRIFADIVNTSIRQVNNIRNGLISATGEVSKDIYEKLTPREKVQIEQIIQKPLPAEFDTEQVNKLFADFFSQSVEQINKIKADLVDNVGRLRQDVYESLTPAEKKAIEAIIQEPLPPTFEYDSIVSVSPISLEAEEAGVDWHIFADSDSLLTISASVFEKPVNTIVVTIRSEAYILKYNQATGNYETVIRAPKEKGTYQMIIQVIYADNSFEEFKKAVLVDPYGYIYIEKYKSWSWKKPWQIFQTEEVRISGGKITIYTLNKVDEWVIWPGNLYNQHNPQTTNATGEFLFIVPPGKYYLTAEAIGFKKFVGRPFEISKEIVNLNIKLNNLFSWAGLVHWLFRWGLMIIIPLIALASLLLWGVHIGIKLGVKKAVERKVKQNNNQPPDNPIVPPSNDAPILSP